MASVPVEVRPDPEDDQALQAWVRVTADEVPLTLLLDTGTQRSAVPHVEPFASRTGLPAGGPRGVLGVSADKTMVEIDRLHAGNLLAEGVLVDLQPPGWRHPALLGMDVLGSHRCDFHFDGRSRIDLDDARTQPTWFQLTSEPHRTPTVAAIWGRTTVNAVWDTGAGVTVVDRSWADRHPEIIAVGQEQGHGTDVTGTEASHPLATMAPCRIGGVEFDEQTVALVDFGALNATLASPVEVILGLPLIARAAWCMDFPGRRWGVRRRPG